MGVGSERASDERKNRQNATTQWGIRCVKIRTAELESSALQQGLRLQIFSLDRRLTSDRSHVSE